MSENITADDLRAKVKRLSSEAGRLKLDLHDLAEDLPNDWEKIMEVAQRTHQKYAELAEARQQLATTEEQMKG